MPTLFEKPTSLTFNSDMTVAVLDPNGVAPTTIIQRDDDWEIEVKLHMDGGATSYLGGTFEVKAYLESIGGGFEGQVGETKIVSLNGNDPQDLPAKIKVPAAKNMPSPQPQAGAYKLVTIMTYHKLNSNKPGEIAGFVEGPVVQLYDPA